MFVGSANPVIISDINEIDSTLPKQRAQSSLALIRPEDYRLSTTSHDSGKWAQFLLEFLLLWFYDVFLLSRTNNVETYRVDL